MSTSLVDEQVLHPLAGLESFFEGTPASRARQAEAVAAALAPLVGDDARYVRGAVFPLDAGTRTP